MAARGRGPPRARPRDDLSSVGVAAPGVLRHAGAFAKGEGFLEIFEAEDLHAAEAIARESPLVELGLATWILRRWDELDLG